MPLPNRTVISGGSSYESASLAVGHRRTSQGHAAPVAGGRLKANGRTAEFHIYPGAPHGFVADYRASYRKEAAEDGWNRMAGWFKKYKVLG
jgi:acetyl esterase/lipase